MFFISSSSFVYNRENFTKIIMPVPPAPIWVCVVPQIVSVLGDCLGQRSSRVFHHKSRRRFILSLAAVSAFQMFLILSVIQLSAPTMTSIIYHTRKSHNNITNGTDTVVVNYCKEPGHNEDFCYSQGPLTIYKALGNCPALLLDGVLNIFYYLGEAMLYRQPLGVLMRVLSALASSFIIAPLQAILNLGGAHEVSPWAVVLGFVGAILCLVERSVPVPESGGASINSLQTVPGSCEGSQEFKTEPRIDSQTDYAEGAEIRSPTKTNEAKDIEKVNLLENPEKLNVPNGLSSCSSKLMRGVTLALSHLPLIGPFLLLAFTYALYFVIMLFYNDKCYINMWGYNAFDQTVLPIFVFSVFFVVDTLVLCRTKLEDEEDQRQTFREACVGCFRELTCNRCQGFFNMFLFRLLVNGRAIAYSYIAITYDLSSSYLQLTLIGVGLSWVATLVLVLVTPSFIVAELPEQLRVKDSVNIGLKIIGSVAICVSLVLLHKS